MEIKIKNKLISKGSPCFIIAEAGVNHNGDINLAKKLIDKAKETGADAVKFQTFKAENLVAKKARMADYQEKNIGKKKTQFEMLKNLELDYKDFIELKKYCDKKKIIFLSTPHSEDAIDFLEPLVQAYKIGSGDLTNLFFLEKIAKKKKPIILSTGMANLEEVREAVETILPINKELILLHCTTNYPTSLNEVNLKAIQTMKKEFNLFVGYSDHTTGINVSLVAVAFGACLIEKHFTLDKNFPGPDQKASLEPKELKEMIEGIRDIEKRRNKGENPEKIIEELCLPGVMGDGIKKPNQSELEVAKVIRKSIVAAKDIKKGTKMRKDMLVIKRPGTGIGPKFINKVIGKESKKDIKKDELIQFEDLL